MKQVLIAVIAIVIAGAGCAPAKMSVSEELRSKEEFNVKGRNGTRIKQKLSFGNYFTKGIHRSWTRGQSFNAGIGNVNGPSSDWANLISIEYINRKQTIRFQLTDNNQVSDVYCVARFNAHDLNIGRHPNSVLNIGIDLLTARGFSNSTYYVQLFSSPEEAKPWEMLIDNQESQIRPKKYIGYLAKSETEYYTIVPVTKMEINGKSGNILAGSIGFEFRDPSGKAVAAVSTLNNGMVFLGDIDPSKKFLLANACAALLLQDAID